MSKHGVYYGTRAVPGGYGIRVVTIKRGRWLTTDLNTTPWPNEVIALERAKRAAQSESEREGGLPVIADNLPQYD